MIITFGDGPIPELEVISAALLGARKSLQRAILDARALRRRLKDRWQQARALATMHTSSTASTILKNSSKGICNSAVDSELLFRAMDGCGDNVRSDVPCGFDDAQLGILFPEEMASYHTWKKAHDAYTEKSGKKTDKGAAGKETDAEFGTDGQERKSRGRLIERLSNFDVRTDHMGEDWYLQFASVRRGSFLPRLGAGKESAAATEWRGTLTKKRGRPLQVRTSWNSLHPTSIIFLHWIGFDPRSALSPPNEETTQALGFLAYDFFGKLVEKAVALRLERQSSKKHAQQALSGGCSTLPELKRGDQLEKGNIEQALVEVDLNSLHSSSNIELGKSANITQLYFGPGFEDRLELEMDEIFGSKEKVLSQEEIKTRQEEEHLFSEIPEVPALLSSVKGVLNGNQTCDSEFSPTSPRKKSHHEP